MAIVGTGVHTQVAFEAVAIDAGGMVLTRLIIPILGDLTAVDNSNAWRSNRSKFY